MKTTKYSNSSVLSLLVAVVLPSISSAQTTTIDFLGSTQFPWDQSGDGRSFFLDTGNPGSIDLIDSRLGGVLSYNRRPTPTPPIHNSSGVRIISSLNGVFELRGDTRFQHSLIDSRSNGFSLGVLNHHDDDPSTGPPVIDEILLLFGGNTVTLSGGDFVLPDVTGDSAYVNYHFTFNQEPSLRQWTVSGQFLNNKGVTLLDVNETFDIGGLGDTELGVGYTIGVSRFPGTGGIDPATLELDNIQTLNWTVIPEPSSMLLLFTGVFGTLLRRRR